MKLSTLGMEVEGQIAVVMMRNPPINSLNAQMMDDINDVFEALGTHPGVRVVVVASALPKAFIAGADIKQFLSWDRELGLAAVLRGHQVYGKIAALPCPVVCAINGFAFGGGLELALACDMRIIEQNATVGLPETGLGILPGYGGSQRLPRLIGTGMAKKMIFSGQPLTGEEAYRIGLAEVLSEPGKSLEDAMTLARQIAGQAPLAITRAKRAIDYAAESSLREGLELEATYMADLFASQDKTEGATAFMEKRKPVFSGK